jgi:copper chaperone CopZ
MKSIIGSSIVALCLSFTSLAFAKDASATFTVKGWHCGGCSGKTASAAKKLKGVKSASADEDSGKLEVAYDDSVTNEKAIVAAVKAVGYDAEKAPAAAPAAKKN